MPSQYTISIDAVSITMWISMDKTPNRAERWLPMDFLLNKHQTFTLIAAWSTQRCLFIKSTTFRQWNNSLWPEAIEWCKTKPISTACYNWISVSHRTIDRNLSHVRLSFWNILPQATHIRPDHSLATTKTEFLFGGNLMFTVVNLLTAQYILYGIHYILWFWWCSSCIRT